VRIGACQTPEILGDVAAAVRAVHDFAAAAGDVDLLVFPECFLPGYLVTPEHVRAEAVDLSSARGADLLGRFAGIGPMLVAGIIERDGTRLGLGPAEVLDPGGTVVARVPLGSAGVAVADIVPGAARGGADRG
jgi:hypothetical protein